MIDFAGAERTCAECNRYHPSDVTAVVVGESIRFLCRECWRENAYQTRKATDD
jgi:ribosomal protein S14